MAEALEFELLLSEPSNAKKIYIFNIFRQFPKPPFTYSYTLYQPIPLPPLICLNARHYLFIFFPSPQTNLQLCSSQILEQEPFLIHCCILHDAYCNYISCILQSNALIYRELFACWIVHPSTSLFIQPLINVLIHLPTYWLALSLFFSYY